MKIAKILGLSVLLSVLFVVMLTGLGLRCPYNSIVAGIAAGLISALVCQ